MQRIHSIDMLKLIIACGVVWAHAILLTGQGGAFDYYFGQGLVRTVVPTFAVISGFLFHSTLGHGKARGWLLRLAIFYGLWCAIYLPVWWPRPASAVGVMEALFFGPLHLWYMAALIVALLAIVLVMRLGGGGRVARRWLAGLALAALLVGTLLQSLHFFGAAGLPMNAIRNGLFVEFPYTVMGFLLADRIRRKGMAGLPEARAAVILLLGLTVLRLAEAGVAHQIYGLDFVAPPEFPLLAAGFSLVVVLVALRLRMGAPPVNLAFHSMMIYFLHFGVLLAALHFEIRGIGVLMALGIGVPVAVAAALLILGQGLQGTLSEVWHRRLFGSAGMRDLPERRGAKDYGALRLP